MKNSQENRDPRAQTARHPAPARVAYIVSRYPKLTETFILNEILAIEKQGVRVELFPLVFHESAPGVPDNPLLAGSVHHAQLFSREVLAAQGYWLTRRPLTWLSLWARAIAGNLRSPTFLARALVVVPLAAWFARRMVERGVTHIHAHWATHPALAALCASSLAGLPYSMTVHAHDLYVKRPMLRAKIAKSAMTVTISDFNRRMIGDLFGPLLASRVKVVRCGVDTSLFAPPPARPTTKMPLLVCVGSLEDYKGHTYLIDAMALLKARGVACRLLCAGSGPLREELREQVRRVGLAGRVRFLGPATPDQVRRLLGAASAVVLASVQTRSGKMEGIPVALMEAMAMERPVVATRLSGVPELVDEGVTGLLVPQRNPMALAGAVALILKDRELAARLGCNARAKVLKDYSLHANVSQLLALMHPFLAPHAVSLASTADMKARRRELLHPAAAEQGRNEVQRR